MTDMLPLNVKSVFVLVRPNAADLVSFTIDGPPPVPYTGDAPTVRIDVTKGQAEAWLDATLPGWRELPHEILRM